MKNTRVSRGLLLLSAAGVWVFAVGCASLNTPPQPLGEVASTANPLVAQYSIQSPCDGQAMIEFGPDMLYGRSTAWYPVAGKFQKTNILVAGMRASTTYHMRSTVKCFGETRSSDDLTFTTGALPSLPFPALTVSRPTPSLSSQENPGIEQLTIVAHGTPELFTDRDGHPIWYYDVGTGNNVFTFKMLANGHILMNVVSPTDTVLREVDLAGNTIREMDIFALQKKIQAAGYDFVPGGFHHDFVELPNGHLIVLLDCGKSFTDLPGYPGTIQVTGDAIVDLDQSWNPVWAWNAFDCLDVNRHLEGLPDWTHSNALVYLPEDGNLLVSVRHQSWILKLDYENGQGSGRILWKLGYQGDFALAQDPTNTQPWLWFSFQHFPSLISQNGQQITLAIWDNGDNRVLSTSGALCVDPNSGLPSPPCYSRATKFELDEGAMVANLAWSDQFPYYSVWGGNINQLPNGNIEYDMNDPQLPPTQGVTSKVQEVTQTSTPQVIWDMDIPVPMSAYRAYRVPSLYPGVTWQY